MLMKTAPRFVLILSLLLASVAAAHGAPPLIQLELDATTGSPARIAMEKVHAALLARHVDVEMSIGIDVVGNGTLIVAGTAKASPSFADIAQRLGVALPTEPEALVVKRGLLDDRSIVLVAGGDELGLAYALYDIADRIGWTNAGADSLAEVRDIREEPAVRDRTVSTYAMQQAYFESRLFDEAYWAAYFDNLVRNRFNNFSLLLGYESSGFLAPSYAWFLSLPEFPEVRALGVTPADQERYVSALNRVVELAHERGLRFTLGFWDHIYEGKSSYYTYGVWDHLPTVDGQRPRWPVQGLSARNLVSYTVAALDQFLQLVPDLDGIQFRTHGESGLIEVGLRNFWEPIFGLMATKYPHIRVDARSKNFPADLVELALRLGVPLRLTMKYYYEQLGLPFQPLHLHRFDQFLTRHGYFDLLKYPQNYKVQWRLWNSGSTRVLLWGDPEFARRFAESTHLYDADGFEISEPLATKMASHPHDLAPIPILNPPYRYYDYEFQRFWPFFMAFGRMAYNPATPADVWIQQFARRFGNRAGPYIRSAIERASWILPRINEYSMPGDKFPTTRGWPERSRWNDLPEYSRAEPGDPQLFASLREEARNLLTGGHTPKIRPQTTARWFHDAGQEVLTLVAEAERLVAVPSSKEFRSAVTDLRMLAAIAEYHSRRIQAGLMFALFDESGNVAALDRAIEGERHAIEAWQQVVDATGDVYSDNVAFGLPEAKDREFPANDLAGHWRDELPKLQLGLEALEKQRTSLGPNHREVAAILGFGMETPLEEGIRRLPLKRDFSLALPNGRYELRFTIEDEAAAFGPMWIESNGSERTDTFQGGAGESVERALQTEVRDGFLNVMFGAESTGRWTARRLVVTRLGPKAVHIPDRVLNPERYPAPDDITPPALLHTPVTSAVPLEPLRVAVKVTDPSGVEWVRLRYRSVTQYQDYYTLEMLLTGMPNEFAAEIPGSHIPARFDFMYFFEVMDSRGNGKIYPDAEKETPYVIVQLKRTEEMGSE